MRKWNTIETNPRANPSPLGDHRKSPMTGAMPGTGIAFPGRIDGRYGSRWLLLPAVATGLHSRACLSGQRATQLREPLVHQRWRATGCRLSGVYRQLRQIRCGDLGHPRRRWACHRVHHAFNARWNGSRDCAGTTAGMAGCEFGHLMRWPSRSCRRTQEPARFQPGSTTRRQRGAFTRDRGLSRLSCAAAIAQHPRRDNQSREESTDQCSHHPRHQSALHQSTAVDLQEW